MQQATSEPLHLIEVISNTLLFFAISGMVIPLLQRIRVSPVVGYLFCGILIGPFGFIRYIDANPHQWIDYISIDNTNTVHILGELGIISLMFMIGLELSFDRLKELRRFIFGLGSAQILISALVIFAIARMFGNSLQASVLIGASFSLSSTAIVMKLLEEYRLANRSIGTLCFSVLLMQDLAVVPMLVLASSFKGDADMSIIKTLLASLVVGAATVAAIYWIGKKLLPSLLQSISFSTTTEWLAAFIVFIVLGCSALTYVSGLSLALGAFMVGLLIAETEFKHEVEVIISPLKGLLMGIFFLSIGMMVDVLEIIRQPGLLFISVIGIYIIKAAIIFVLCLLFKIAGRQSAEAAVYLAQPGEFALMILGVAMYSNLMPAHDVQFFLLVTVLAMMLTPLLFKLAPVAGEFSHKIFTGNESLPTSFAINDNNKVVIAGFGCAARTIAKILEEGHIPYLAFDHNGKRVKKYKEENYNVIYGDARKKELWKHLIGKNIEVAIIAIDDSDAIKPILKSLRAEYPLLPVIVRAKDDTDLNALYDEGANYVVAETVESSLRISQILMEKFGDAYKEIDHAIKKIRSANALN